MAIRLLTLPIDSFRIMTLESRRKFLFAIVFQSCLGILDLIGVLITGLIGIIAAFSFRNENYPTYIANYLDLSGLGEMTAIQVILLLALTALVFFVGKSLGTIYFSRRVFRFLGSQQSVISSRIIGKVFDSDYAWMRDQDVHRLSNTLSLGVPAATINVLGQSIILISESSLLVIFTILLFIVNPILAAALTLYLSVILLLLNYGIGRRVTNYNESMRGLLNVGKQDLFSSLQLFREIRVLNRQNTFKKKLSRTSEGLAENYAKDIWIQQVPKYAMEIALLFGMTAIISIASVSSEPQKTLPVLLIYITASARIFPTLLRIQAAILSLRSFQPLAKDAHDLFSEISSFNQEFSAPIGVKNIVAEMPQFSSDKLAVHDGIPHINISNINFRYRDAQNLALKNVSFEVDRGERVALVGPSGSGKSTLCDIILGLLEPESGSLKIEGVVSNRWVSNNPGKVSYVPQDTVLLKGTLTENICMGIEREDINLDQLQRAVSNASLDKFIETLPEGLDTRIGEGFTRLSGGQRQRIGIARAIYNSPQILIMDEATSSLDAETEDAIMSFLKTVGQETTLIFIAHRLSSVRNFSRLIYFEDGKLISEGTFEYLRSINDGFNTQANLLGL